jgi:hypothetical protein
MLIGRFLMTRFIIRRAFILIGAKDHNSPHMIFPFLYVSVTTLENHEFFIAARLIRVLVSMEPEIGLLKLPVWRLWRTKREVF